MQGARGTSALETLIYSVLPGLSALPDRERAERVDELIEFAEDILESRLPSSLPLGSSALPDAARAALPSSADTLQFNSLWSNLERNRTLSNPSRHLQFLLALSSFNAPSDGAFPLASSSTTRQRHRSAFGTPAPPRPAAATILGERSENGVPPAHPKASRTAPRDGAAGHSKAEMLREWRAGRHRPPFPESLLLRDVLYLLQGIDGRYVRFALAPPAERNPYLSEKGRAGDGLGFPLGVNGAAAPVNEEGDVVGIDIVADESKVGLEAKAYGHASGRLGSAFRRHGVHLSLAVRVAALEARKTKVDEGVVWHASASVCPSLNLSMMCTEAQFGFISQPTRSILVQLSEMGMLYRKITKFIETHQANGQCAKSGMVVQSLCHFLHHELSEYHRLLAVLESQMGLTAADGGAPAEGSGLTLMRLGLWTEEMRLKLRLMDTVVDDANSAHGGALVSKIHKHKAHGDPFVRHFTDQILEEVSKPFFLTLQRWILSGELHDPFNEFFVQLNPDVKSDDTSPYATGDLGFEEGFDSAGDVSDAHQLWEKKYVFVKAMMPGFINEDFGKKIFSTGRSLNFIRYNCYDSEWIAEQTGSSTGEALKYSDLTGLERSIDDAYSKASKHLLEIFYDKYHFMSHLHALKSYLMLGAGDFAELLMESLAPRLSKPAISLYRHHLTSDLESAIRGSNAQYDPPDVLRRLDARILEYSHGELGWDCFALEYRVEAPLNVLLDPRAMEGYDRLFHHLWRLKRVETALTQGWMRVTSASRAFETLPNLDNLWHHCRIVQAEMVHFLRQLQAFCQLEVIECSWQALLAHTDKRDGDLDALITAHRTYLDRVVRKILLLGPRKDKDDTLLGLVREALDNILKFHDSTEDLYAWSLGEATRLDRVRDAERGLSGRDSAAAEAEGTASFEQLEGIRERIRVCATAFQDAVTQLCKEAGSHADLDIRFLAIRIAFNGHYSLRRTTKVKKDVK